jgi:hypothetical protein
MTYDRTYWRMVSDTRLTETARYCDNDLALVLGERLETLLDVQDRLDDAKTEIAELNARLDIWQAEAVELHRQLDVIGGKL